MAELPRSDRLAKLPKRALVAYAARCVRRVQPLYRPKGSHPHPLELNRMRAVDFALDLAEQFADGAEIDADSVRTAVEAAAALGSERGSFLHPGVAQAAGAACAAIVSHVAAALAAYAASLSLDQAATADVAESELESDADREAARRACASDLRTLAELSGKNEHDESAAVDPRPLGPLGPYWPDGEPGWYPDALAKHESLWREAAEV